MLISRAGNSKARRQCRNLTLATSLEQPHLPGGTSHPQSMIYTNASFTTCYHKISIFVLLCPTVNHRMAIHSSILTWRISWTEEPGRLQSVGSQRVRHDWATNNLTFTETKGPECRPKKWEKHKELMTKFKGNIAEKYLDCLQFHLSYLLKNILPPFLLYFSQLLAWGLSAMY